MLAVDNVFSGLKRYHPFNCPPLPLTWGSSAMAVCFLFLFLRSSHVSAFPTCSILKLSLSQHHHVGCMSSALCLHTCHSYPFTQSRALSLRLASVRYASTSLRDRVAKLIPEQLETVISHRSSPLIHPFSFRSRLPVPPMAKKRLLPSRSTSSTGRYTTTSHLLL